MRRVELSAITAEKIFSFFRKNIKIETSEALERMYRVLSACLEFLEEQYQVTLLIQIQFSLFPGKVSIEL